MQSVNRGRLSVETAEKQQFSYSIIHIFVVT
jgi:hypothetical protein